MRSLQPSTLLKKKFTFNILDSIETEIEVVENPYEIPIEELFHMAARINKKRSFLFVSKVLGKHLPIDPNKGLVTAALLAARFAETIKRINSKEIDSLLSCFSSGSHYSTTPFISKDIHPVIIGFAETATALGHAFFACFQSAEYFHTTREDILDKYPKITFEEEHSHATSHRCYIPLEMIENGREIILVDDELTTGKTALNIIESIHNQFPRKEYTVVSILDWRSEDNKKRFRQLEHDLGIKIHVVSLLYGQVKLKKVKEITDTTIIINNGIEPLEQEIDILNLSPFFTATNHLSRNRLNSSVYIKETGRFGLNSHENILLCEKISEAAKYLRQKRHGTKTLCLGSGEFMYIPMKMATEMGSNVFYQSTTRSPIHIENKHGYGARFGVHFPNPEDMEISHHVYNIPPNYYDELFIFFEREVDGKNLEPLLKEMRRFGFQSIKIIFFSKA